MVSRLINYKIYIGVLFLITLLFNCSYENNFSYETIYIDSARRGVTYSEFFEEISFVVLHGMPENEVISHFEKIIPYEGGYICWENKQRAIYLFNIDGKYIRHIKSIGGGPQEYVDIGDIAYDVKNKNICVLDRGHFIVRYDLDGNSVSKIKLPITAGNITVNVDGEEIFHSSTQSECVIWKFNKEHVPNCFALGGNIFNKYIFNSEFKFTHFPSSTSEILFTTPMSGNIYSLIDNKVSKKFMINFGENEVFRDVDANGMSPDEILNHVNGEDDFIIYQGKMFSSKDWLIIGMYNKLYINSHDDKLKSPQEYIFYNSKYGVFSSNLFIDDRKFRFSWRICGSNEKALIHQMYYSDMERIIKDKMNIKDVRGNNISEIINSKSEILILMKLK